jgi:asparagine synthase (glutamine-hydrolysing)
MLGRLQGMFAIAIADLRAGRLHAARDHFGIKPLYWWQGDDVLLIASEIKAFLRHPAFRAVLAEEHLAEQLMFRYCAWDRTLLRGVRQLPPGHALSWRPGEAPSLHRYWALPDATSDQSPDDATAEGQIRHLLREAVREQLISDVPLGTQLSGGIDSSLVTLDAARARLGQRIPAFSIIFEDPRISEDPWIDQAAAAAGAESHRYLFAPGDFAADFEKVAWHLDGPPGNPNTLALHLLAARARDHVKVLLTGEGCDELFAGYNRFYYSALQQRHPRLIRAAAKLGGRRNARWWRFLGEPGASAEQQTVLGSAYGAAAWVRAMLPSADPESAIAARVEHLSNLPGSGVVRQIRYEAETYLPDLLLRQDKMTMAHGLECRVPFLDLKLAAAARRLRPDLLAKATCGLNARMRGTKRIIKAAAAREFGSAFAMRRKRGFDVPLASFFRGRQVRERFEEEWLPGIRRRGVLAEGVADNLWKKLNAGDDPAGCAEALWVAVGLEVWARQVLD